MKTMIFSGVAALCIFLSVPQGASAQTLLQRLSQRLEETLEDRDRPQTPAPAPAPAAPPVVRETLPAPREATSPAATRAALGIRVSPVTDDAVRAYQLVVRRGALISAIEKGSSADRAGLPLGGVIVALNGRRIDSPDDLVQTIRSMQPGQDVELTYYEANRLNRKRVHLMPVGEGDLQPIPEAPQPLPAGPITPLQPSGPSSGPSLEQQLNAEGSRPLLGRIGRVLDSVVAPAQAVVADSPNVVNRVDPASETAALRQQVQTLQKQVELMQQRIDALEQKLKDSQ